MHPSSAYVLLHVLLLIENTPLYTVLQIQDKLGQPVHMRVQIKRSGEMSHRQKVCRMRKYLQYKTWKHEGLLAVKIRNKPSMCKQLSLTHISFIFLYLRHYRFAPNLAECLRTSRPFPRSGMCGPST